MIPHLSVSTVAEKTGALSLGLSAVLFFTVPLFAIYPLLCFVSCCALAPFFPEWSFFLPIISHGSRNKSAISLTFDDGPSPQSTPYILDLLAHHNIKATFFIIGKKGRQHPDILKEIIKQGHTIGNHSWSHDNLLMFRQLATLTRDIQKTQFLLAEQGVEPLVFRAPIGITGPRLAPVLQKLGLFAVNFSARAYDRGNRNIRHLAKKLLASIHAGDIVLLHDSAPRGADQQMLWQNELERLCGKLQSRFQIVPLAKLIDRPVMVVTGNEQGHTTQLSAEQ